MTARSSHAIVRPVFGGAGTASCWLRWVSRASLAYGALEERVLGGVSLREPAFEEELDFEPVQVEDWVPKASNAVSDPIHYVEEHLEVESP